ARGQRVFPKSDHSSDIIRALEQTVRKSGVTVLLNTEVIKIKNTPLEEDTECGQEKKQSGKKKQRCCAKVSQIELYDKTTGRQSVMQTDKLIVATGGCSYVLTGSTGDGYRFAAECGHRIVPTMPALVPFAVKEKWCHQLQGLSLKNVQASVVVDGKQIYSDFGELLFTHYGVSGPLILSASSHYAHKACVDGNCRQEAKLLIDLKPALTKEQLDKRVLREFDENKNKQFKNVINSLFPAKLIPLMPVLSDINPDKRVNEITKEERERFVQTIKHVELTITGLRDYNEAVITKGGVATNEVSPSTMESKLVKGLYFAGEVLDLDALTGGFNLQIAWSTGYLAGSSAAASYE
ncbi:MAG: aminoacetone oxidase family FAD-binding enzyme, partial [Lachnospiraceae bacterium]|nr:aminoacetone oxidase family FAD-binding enzyme [Lachnospiraceae bacterium]